MTRTLVASFAAVWFAILAGAPPAAAQNTLSFRPFVMVNDVQFAAKTTFDAVFDKHSQVLFGGGLNITQDEHFYLELSASRFEKTGQRAFLNNGEAFGLGIPLTVTFTPLEATAGYRFHAGPRLWPYLGAGAGLYRYKESSDFSTDDENVDTRHAGAIVEGGLEFRVHRWIGVAADIHYSYVPGILGDAGLSKEAGEKNLGGVSARFKLIIGK